MIEMIRLSAVLTAWLRAKKSFCDRYRFTYGSNSSLFDTLLQKPT
jgi:hypothetical protein